MTQRSRKPKDSPSFPCSAEEAEWRSIKPSVRLYGWLSTAALLVGSIFLAHPGLLGLGRFTTCQSSGCVLAMHLIEIPIIGYLLFVSLYALLRANPRTAARFGLFLGFANAVAAGFFLFDGVLLLESFRRESPLSEKLLYVTAMSLMLVGVSVGCWVRSRVSGYLHPPLDPNLEHPRTEEELIQLVKKALAYGVQLRVRGSTHCVPGGIHADPSGGHINVQLDRYTRILEFVEVEGEDRALVTVQGGCHLGVDPNDPLSNKKNSLLWQLDKLGWALPDLGGITHQTVSGFLSTGSMGGTIQHNLGGALVGIRLIDGNGVVRDLTPKDEEFYAAGVSMGLLGIVSTVTLECTRRYNIKGKQVVSATRECPARLFEPGKDGLEGFFSREENQYTRLLWWPQRGVHLVDLWTGEREEIPRGLRNSHKRIWSGLKAVLTRPFKLRPLVPLPRIVQRLIVRPFYTYLAKTDPLPYKERTEKFVSYFLRVFLHKKEKCFWDVWYKALPMDDSISDKLVPTDFTELFIDIAQTDKLMRVLNQYFCPVGKAKEEARGMARTGSYAFEIYPGHQSHFWMSPSYGRHSIRLDVFWFRAKQEGREKFFKQFWRLMEEEGIDFRLHWGKYLPDAKDPKVGAAYLRKQYPEREWNKFMELRQKWDPKGIFLSTYWKEHLGLAAPTPHLHLAPPDLGLEVKPEPASAPVRPDWRLAWLRATAFVIKLAYDVVDLFKGAKGRRMKPEPELHQARS